jgi:hypothetical protein
MLDSSRKGRHRDKTHYGWGEGNNDRFIIRQGSSAPFDFPHSVTLPL